MDNIHPIFDRALSRAEKENLLNQNSKVIWFTGLSGSGKSTIALALERRLYEVGFFTQLLDGDNIRTGINNNLSFTQEDREENIRRIAEVSKLFCSSGIVCINSFVSPTLDVRAKAKEIIGEDNFLEIFVNTPLEVCESRDVKGLYKKARKGEIKNFTGIDAPFEHPTDPFLEILTENQTIEESTDIVFNSIIKLIKKN
jgi:adenylylsulfate kinase